MASSNSFSTSISAKSGNELRAMIWDEMELQSANVEENVSIFLDLSQPRDDGNQDMKETMSKHPKIASLPNLAIDVNAPTTDSFKGSKTDELPQIECSMSIDDLVNCKVITPMIMKIHSKYMTSMQDAMQLMKYLETVPRLVGQIYKDNITLEKRKL
ncbi:GL14578 [Drosophila persimilis]|uniref:GL14578 n=1 Tax=Drosophila persimilis TaxID=7234 RepID=B4GVY0_DROPE|nr:GL14578 [Drosophila persimilis]